MENAGSEGEEETPSREPTPSPPVFGPLPPTPSNSFGGFGSVGNDTLWGNSLPKGSDDGVAIESLTEGVSLDEGLGGEQEMGAVFVSVPVSRTAEPEGKVEEVRLGEGEGLQG